MIKLAIKPAGWNHPSLNLHRQWHLRHGLSLRARQALILLVPSAILMWVFSSPWWLLVALLGLVWHPAWLPFQWHEQRTLEVVSQQHGDAYATALIAPTDPFGFSKRLESQAQNIERNAELPNLPWLEVLAAAVIVSLVWLIPARGNSGNSLAAAGNETNLERRLPAESLPENDPGVTGAPVTNPAPQGQTQSSSPNRFGRHGGRWCDPTRCEQFRRRTDHGIERGHLTGIWSGARAWCGAHATGSTDACAQAIERQKGR
jgi:hypothetical protein